MRIDSSELRTLAASLEREGPRLGRRAAGIIRSGSRDLTAAARRNAPRRSGDLADSIEGTIYGDGRSSAITAVVGPTERYGLFQERGTSHNAPQPFLAPALDAVAPGVVSALEGAAAEALR